MEAIASVAPFLALVPLQKDSIDFHIVHWKCPCALKDEIPDLGNKPWSGWLLSVSVEVTQEMKM